MPFGIIKLLKLNPNNGCVRFISLHAVLHNCQRLPPGRFIEGFIKYLTACFWWRENTQLFKGRNLKTDWVVDL